MEKPENAQNIFVAYREHKQPKHKTYQQHRENPSSLGTKWISSLQNTNPANARIISAVIAL
jgi:hypothetical protein